MLSVSRATRRRRHLGFVIALAVLSGACASSAPPEPSPPPAPATPAPEERPYLVSPLQGWGEPVPAEAAALLEEGFAAIEAGDPDGARAALDSLARVVPEPGTGVDTGPYPPAAVLAAQADLLDGRAATAQARLEPLAESYPDYTALQLALGRATSRTGDLVSSYAAFRRAAAVSDLAFERAGEMAPRVAEILARRVGDALQRAEAGPERVAAARLEEAGEALDLLDRWFPDAPTTLTLSVAVAEARDDRQAELEALRRLVPRAGEIGAEMGPVPGVGEPEPRRLLERQAELELEVGDSRTGLDLFSDLVEQYPDDPRLAERLAFAKFRWRVDQMPPRVATAASILALERGDLAVLLYWLVPRVRSASGGQARIASDILDDPRREEIARVLNLELMNMDTAVYRFYPEREALRADALEAVLRVLRRFGGATCTPPPLPEAGSEAAAAGDGAAQDGAATPAPRVCRAAVECGLIDPDEPCRPGEPVSGGEAVDLLRRALAWMAGSGDR